MFDAAGAATGVEAAREATAEAVAAETSLVPEPAQGGFDDGALAAAAAVHDLPGGRDVVVIDAGLPDWRQLADAVAPGAEVIVLSAGGDGLGELAARLPADGSIRGLHVLSHGSGGHLQLGAAEVNAESIAERSADWRRVGEALTADGDILLYACDAGGNAELLDAISQHAGADVAGSSDRTGSAAMDGDWDLEVAVGSIETQALALDRDGLERYGHTLSDPLSIGAVPEFIGEPVRPLENLVLDLPAGHDVRKVIVTLDFYPDGHAETLELTGSFGGVEAGWISGSGSFVITVQGDVDHQPLDPVDVQAALRELTYKNNAVDRTFMHRRILIAVEHGLSFINRETINWHQPVTAAETVMMELPLPPVPDATEDTAFTWDVPNFVGTHTIWSASLADGSVLPSWLAFDAATRTFSGTPANGDVGSISLRVTATSFGRSVAETFDLTVTNTNDAPTVAAAIPAQAAPEDAAFSYTVPAGAFADVDAGDTLAWSASLADGSVLPSWLAFDAATRTFSGTPANSDVGALSVRVTATDAAGAAVSQIFGLTVVNVNDPPRALREGLTASATRDTPVAMTLPRGLFSEIDPGDRLTLWAEGLPAGLRLSPGGDRINGSATAPAGVYDAVILARDSSGATARMNLQVRVLGLIEGIGGTDGSGGSGLPAPGPRPLSVLSDGGRPVAEALSGSAGRFGGVSSAVTGALGSRSTIEIGDGPVGAAVDGMDVAKRTAAALAGPDWPRESDRPSGAPAFSEKIREALSAFDRDAAIVMTAARTIEGGSSDI